MVSFCCMKWLQMEMETVVFVDGRSQEGKREKVDRDSRQEMSHYLPKLIPYCTAWVKSHNQAEFSSFTYGTMNICFAVSL